MRQVDYALLPNTRRITRDDCPWRDVLNHHRPCADYRSLSNRYARSNEGICTDPNLIVNLDRRPQQWKLGASVIVRTSADVRSMRNRRARAYPHGTKIIDQHAFP